MAWLNNWFDETISFSFQIDVLAMAVPKVDVLIGLVGALCLSMLGFVIPSLMDICVRYPDAFGTGKIHLIFDTTLMVLGLGVLVTGLWTNIKEI